MWEREREREREREILELCSKLAIPAGFTKENQEQNSCLPVKILEDLKAFIIFETNPIFKGSKRKG